MGGPDDDYYYSGWRDWGQGEKAPLRPIVDPECPTPLPPAEQAKHDALVCALRQMFQRSVVFTKNPANVQPPWFARPIIKTKNIVVAANTTGVIFDREIPERNRAILSCIGIDVAPLLPLYDQTLEFWFDLGNEQQVIPIFDDQTEQAYESSTGLKSGRTTILPGNVGAPFNFLANGLQSLIKGKAMLRFMVENKSDVAVTIRGVMGYYQYWLPYGADEFENADVQL
jgi:hypothetical protein